MGVATLADKTFRIDPSSVSWDFKTKTSETYTLGGKVIQVFGTTISDMQVTGAFGSGGWRQQLLFLQQMKNLGNQQVAAGRTPNNDIQPFRFTYAPRGWDFLVYLKSFASPEGPSVVHSNENFNPKWRLSLFIVEDNSGLKRVAQEAYISRMAEGIGWRQTVFNGPLGDQAFSQSQGNQTQSQSPGGVE